MFLFKGLIQPRCEELITAIRASKVEEAQNLIERMSQSELSKIDSNGDIALTWAAEKGLEKVCELLIPKMSDQVINHINNNGETALSLAIKNNFKNICDLLTLKSNEQNKTNIEKDYEAQPTKILITFENNELNELIDHTNINDATILGIG
nr:ankyrin repeat domain-containing protein [Rickettsia endosymbiont of Ceutorhynchus assimilis]